jgi:DNA-binding GntR family transcriptional regulator
MSYTLSVTRKEAVLRQLRTEIVNGKLVPGTVLKDAEVARRVGLSITPVREAIAQLAAEGLIDVAPNRTRHVTHVTRKNALDLVDVMAVLTCAGFEWGMASLNRTHLITLRRQYEEFAENLRQGDVTAAASSGADFSRTIVLASGNNELQTHIDLVVARTLRILALTPGSSLWTVWLDGYHDTLELLEAGDNDAALERYRQIYTEYRSCVNSLPFD